VLLPLGRRLSGRLPLRWQCVECPISALATRGCSCSFATPAITADAAAGWVPMTGLLMLIALRLPPPHWTPGFTQQV
jgi:hypothetical protein